MPALATNRYSPYSYRVREAMNAARNLSEYSEVTSAAIMIVG